MSLKNESGTEFDVIVAFGKEDLPLLLVVLPLPPVPRAAAGLAWLVFLTNSVPSSILRFFPLDLPAEFGTRPLELRGLFTRCPSK